MLHFVGLLLYTIVNARNAISGSSFLLAGVCFFTNMLDTRAWYIVWIGSTNYIVLSCIDDSKRLLYGGFLLQFLRLPEAHVVASTPVPVYANAYF